MVKKDLADFGGKYSLYRHAVITLVYEDSMTNDQYFSAVRVSTNSAIYRIFGANNLLKA